MKTPPRPTVLNWPSAWMVSSTRTASSRKAWSNGNSSPRWLRKSDPFSVVKLLCAGP
jgi:hypothetical protein